MRIPQKLVLLTPLFVLLSLAGCNRKQKAAPISENLSNIVYAYTSGTISKQSAIKIRFTDPAIADAQVGETVSESFITFSPSVRGAARWEDTNTLLFEPEELKSATEYLATVQTGKIFPHLPKESATFEFNFRTKDLYFFVDVDGFQAPDVRDLKQQELLGALRSSDGITPNQLENLLTATQNGNTLPLRWVSNAAQTEHQFTVESIVRGEKAGAVQLAWDGTKQNIDESKGEQDVEVPALGDFKVVDAKILRKPQQAIALYFSDPIDAQQNLDGLLSIGNYNGNLSTSVDGNQILMYPSGKITGTRTITAEAGVKNIAGAKMKNPSTWTLDFQEEKPKVRLVGNGVIMPNSEGLIFPFEAVNLSAVDLEIFKIYNNNILQFLQSNSLDGNYDLQRVGKVVFQKKIDLLSINPKANPNGWNRYALDLSDFMQKDPQAIYQVRLGFRLGYADYYCGEDILNGLDVPKPLRAGQTNEAGDYESIFDGYYGIYGYYGGYRYKHRDDPCYPAYYNEDQFARSNVLVSDLGMIAKTSATNDYSVVVSDLRTAQPVSGATIEFFDYQQQVMAKATTNSKGIASTQLPKKPFVIVSRKDDKVGYVKIKDGRSLSVSRFEVGGVAVQDGIKGYLYGERGVWRPGDSVYLHFVLDDQDKGLPADHPIRFTLLDARGTEVETRTTSNNTGQIYPLHFATSKDAPTGNWTAKVEVGGARFTKYLRIETVKPNRLKIDLDFGKDRLVNDGKPIRADLAVNWLHGAPGSNLKTIIELQLSRKTTKFKNYGDFTFDDPARRFNSEPKIWFEQRVNADGKVEIAERITTNTSAPGVLRAQFKTRAFEKGGDFSTDSKSVDYYPYQRFTGLRIPARPTGEKRLDVGQKDKVQMVLVDTDGKAISGEDLSVGLYRVDWRWWWDEGDGYLADYNSSTHYNAQANGTVRTNAKGEAEWEVSVERWGRYLVRVCDGDGHCTGDFFYAGYPWDEEGGFNRQEAAMLAFSSNKPEYQVGETIEIKVPATVDSRMLVSVENGNGVLQSFWENAESGENVIRIPATAAMTPNIYVHLALIQPHAQTKNDLPMRMYGVLPITVKDPKSALSPSIEMADVLKPEEEFTVKVKETSGQDMSYTIAVVDDGLLDLTRFKTPNPWSRFYAKEALGVKTYDIYDYILGAYGGNLERLLSIGGDAEGAAKPKEESANRFKPVVLHAGPFTVKKGQTAKHTFTMPNYVGSVRTMVVAANDGAYGNAEKTTPVRKPLMVLSTLPRVLGPSEELVMPVNVFAMEDQVKNVTIEVKETTGKVLFSAGQSQSISFSKPGEQVVGFPIRINRREGVARFEIKATSGREVATQSIEIDIRNPNAYVTEVSDYQLAASSKQKVEIIPIGVPGSNKAVIEVSALPPLDLGRNLDYLLRYPYGCIEQTTSSGFPQVYLDRLLPLDDAQKATIKRNVQATVNRLQLFQTPEGHFTYWPGAGNHISHWANSYAGHFLLIAKDQGYEIPGNLLRNWERAQKRLAKAWDPRQNEAGFYSSRSNELSQAYRLYTLALTGKPELSAMNRLRESAKLSPIAKWRLAAAYALAGQKEIASQLIDQLPKSVDPYQEFSGSYGSALRDKAMILETLLLLDKADESATLMKAMSEDLSSGRWHSTQTTAYCLQSIGQFVEKYPPGKELKFQFKADNDRPVDMGSKTPIVQIELEEEVKSVDLTNQSGGVLFTRLIRSGKPMIGEEVATNKNLEIQVAYFNTEGARLDISTLEQGTDFVAEVSITHPGYPYTNRYDELALDQVFPSGWEIMNTRMDNLSYFSNTSSPEYQDIRDDRVYTFFDLPNKSRSVFRVRLNATYQGKYYLPGVNCAAMYSDDVYARNPGQWVEVIAPQIN